MRRIAILASLGSLLLMMPVGYLSLLSWFSRRPAELGVTDGKLAGRQPSKPNWVSSFADSDTHRMAPLHVTSKSPGDTLDRLEQLILAMPGARVVTRSDRYLHAEFRSRLFRFVDDAEFLVSPDGATVQFTSAARSGHSDFGVNRQRIEYLQQALSASSTAGG
ncbi:MAG TPA: DUF1499 domain-containing protein [Planctomycetaceae bacterium]|nr:DUF1499 domain-containing protein [Planctomycetaceae bacterium]